MKFCDLIIVAGCLSLATSASSASLGPSQGSVVLGSPIDLFFDVKGDGPQTSATEACVTAQVWLGDFQLPAHQVRIAPRARQVRLQTTSSVNEPLVTIKLTAGCASTVTRSYTLFADPPKFLAPSQSPIDLKKLEIERPPEAAKPRAASQPTQRAASKPAVAKPTEKSVRVPPTATPQQPLEAVGVTPSTGKPMLRIEPILGLDKPSNEPPTAAPSDAGPDTNDKLVLQLDTNTGKLAALEQQLTKLQDQLRKNHSETTALRQQLAQINSETPPWLYALLALLAISLGAIAWLLQRLRQEQLKSQQAWSHMVAAQTSAPAAAATTSAEPSAFIASAATAPASNSETDAISGIQSPPYAAADLASQHVPNEFEAAHPQPASSTLAPPLLSALPSDLDNRPDLTREAQALAQLLTAQALLEVQEEAEFYASIGENDQAIHLLESHIAAHENSSPLAYLELLQLLHRLSRTEAYERTREKFQKHFNVRVPAFLGFAIKGGDLWSSYPEVLGKIEAHWPTDNIHALLRDLILYRETNLSEGIPRFDLAAFDDLLMLYNVCRTTSASERGEATGRFRTAPTEVPLPEVNFALSTALDAPERLAQEHAHKNADFVTAPPPEKTAHSYSPEFDIDFLSATSSDSLPISTATNKDSPFQDTSHFTPDEVLMASLTLEWDSTPSVSNTLNNAKPDTEEADKLNPPRLDTSPTLPSKDPKA